MVPARYRGLQMRLAREADHVHGFETVPTMQGEAEQERKTMSTVKERLAAADLLPDRELELAVKLRMAKPCQDCPFIELAFASKRIARLKQELWCSRTVCIVLAAAFVLTWVAAWWMTA